MSGPQVCTPQLVSKTLWAYATLGIDPGQHLENAAAQQLLRSTRDLMPQAIANSLWAYVKLGHTPDDECLHALAAQPLHLAHRVNPQHISNAMWAFDELGWTPTQAVTSGMLSSMQLCMARANPQDIKYLLPACVKLGVQPEQRLLQEATSRMGAVLHAATSQNISQFTWACAKLGFCPAAGFTQAAIERMLRLMPDASERSVSNILWASAMLLTPTSPPPSREFLIAASERLQQLLADMDDGALCQVATAYAKFCHKPINGLLDGMARHFQLLQPTSQGSKKLMRKAYSSLGLRPILPWFSSGLGKHEEQDQFCGINGQAPRLTDAPKQSVDESSTGRCLWAADQLAA